MKLPSEAELAPLREALEAGEISFEEAVAAGRALNDGVPNNLYIAEDDAVEIIKMWTSGDLSYDEAMEMIEVMSSEDDDG